MSQGLDLARAALDTLPVNVAVVDPDGEILLTNRAWKDFAVDEGGVDDPDDIGGNYLAASDATDDEYAGRATEGIRAVLDGDRDAFTMEYPCHSPDQQRWFLMRVSAVPGDGDRQAVVAHVDITDRKQAELAADARADETSHVLERVNGLVGEVTASVVHARSRGEAEAAACEQFVGTSPYRFAWVARPDLRSDRLVPAEWAGDPPAEFADRSLDLTADDPTARAFETGEVQLVDDLSTVATDWDPAELWDGAALAAIPLTYRSKTYGVLTAYADDAGVCDERERAVLEALGYTIATAIHALTTGRALSSASVIEVEMQVSDPDTYLSDLTAGGDVAVTYQDSMVDDEGTLLLYLTVEETDAETVERRAAGHDDVTGVRVLTGEGTDRLLVELAVAESVVSDVADHDGVVEALTATDGTASVTASFPDEDAARTAFEHLDGRYEGVELTGYRERERGTDTAGGFSAAVESALTERQLTALRTAYLSGYFDWPRPVSGDEVADSMDITRATFHQHLREAQRKLAGAFFENGLPE